VDRKPVSRTALSWLWLVLGSFCFVFLGWRFNVPLASWLAPLFLIRFFRDRPRWPATLAAIPLLAVASFVQLNGGWDLDPWMMYAFCLLRPGAFLAALYLDRALRRRLPILLSTLVYPAVYLAVDYAVSFTPLGTVMSASATQFGFPAVAQLASITGIWGIGFLSGWAASALNTAWDLRSGKALSRRMAGLVAVVLAAVLCYGSARSALARPSSPTVRVGSVTVEHPRDYWTWIDRETPRAVVEAHAGELSSIQEALFAQSARAVAAGAKIVFWSEGNGVVPEDQEAAFRQRAAAFAKAQGIWFAPAVVVLRYGSTLSDNKILVFSPDGTPAFTYVKTKSWYPTGSDGVLKTVDTPYGRLGAAICFDMDFPSFIRGLGRKKADIVLVPSFDTERIRQYHTEAGLMRGLENGFSVVRQVNQGTSMAIDGSGRVLARQEYFETADRLMIADVPTKRIGTPYAVLGDWFAYAGILLAAALVAAGAMDLRRKPQGSAPA